MNTFSSIASSTLGSRRQPTTAPAPSAAWGAASCGPPTTVPATDRKVNAVNDGNGWASLLSILSSL